MLGVQHEARGLCGARGGLLGGRRGCGWAGLHDALVNYADVNVVLVDRRHGVGGHWLNAYPFVRLHQASSFYGVASTRLGEDRLQENGPEAGMHERATVPEICAYYARVRERLLASGQVSFYPNCDYLGEVGSFRAYPGKVMRCAAGAASSTPATSPR
jgi:hypothetical protein